MLDQNQQIPSVYTTKNAEDVHDALGGSGSGGSGYDGLVIKSVGNGLVYSETSKSLSVNTVDEMISGSKEPMSSNGVHLAVGAIEVLLATI